LGFVYLGGHLWFVVLAENGTGPISDGGQESRSQGYWTRSAALSAITHLWLGPAFLALGFCVSWYLCLLPSTD